MRSNLFLTYVAMVTFWEPREGKKAILDIPVLVRFTRYRLLFQLVAVLPSTAAILFAAARMGSADQSPRLFAAVVGFLFSPLDHYLLHSRSPPFVRHQLLSAPRILGMPSFSTPVSENRPKPHRCNEHLQSSGRKFQEL